MQTPIYPNTLDINQLLDDLNSKFPDVMPDLNLSEKEYGFRVGQVSVVRYLKHKLLDEE
tara:strand:- start:732 stop:908 length:177 start_codon:yes stop_codon:yes gene_type:complete